MHWNSKGAVPSNFRLLGRHLINLSRGFTDGSNQGLAFSSVSSQVIAALALFFILTYMAKNGQGVYASITY